MFIRQAVIALMFSTWSFAFANHYAHLNWKQSQTKHFTVFYTDETKWTAQKVCAIADDVYEKVTAIYNFKPKHKTRIVLRDEEDTSNGFAVFNLDFITLWASPSQMRLRGREDWVRGVLTHEFSHIVSLQKSSPSGLRIENLRLGGVGNTDNTQNIDFGISGLVLSHPYERWWAEGTAQLDTEHVGYDPWDTSRDMFLRSATLENNLLTSDELRNISISDNLHGEKVYNHGFAFLRWLKQTYGEKINTHIAHDAQTHFGLMFTSIERVTQKPFSMLYNEWTAHLKKHYASQVTPFASNLIEGQEVGLVSDQKLKTYSEKEKKYRTGLGSAHPRFSKNGLWFGFVDRGFVRLQKNKTPFVLDSAHEKTFRIALEGSDFDFSPDSQHLVLTKASPTWVNAYPYHDLFMGDLETLEKSSKLTRLTTGARATSPRFDVSGTHLFFAQNKDGSRTLEKLNLKNKKTFRMFRAPGGQVLDITVSPSSKVAFSLNLKGQTNVWMMNEDGTGIFPLTSDKADKRDVFFLNDHQLLYSSDTTGFFQIYELDLRTKIQKQVSQTLTGAFMPFVTPQNELYYSRFTSFGFKIYKMPYQTFENAHLERDLASVPEGESFASIQNEKPYLFSLRPVRAFPSVLVENKQFKAGVALELSDILEKHQLTLSGLFGSDQDLQVSYLNRQLSPAFYASFTSYVRNASSALLTDNDTLNDEALVQVRNRISFVQVGAQKDFYSDGFIEGTHVLDVSYLKRFVNQNIGIPLIHTENGASRLLDQFKALDNNSVSFKWSFSNAPKQRNRDFDLTPKGLSQMSLEYRFTHTHLFEADASIPSPNQNYTYHEGNVQAAHTFDVPWTHPWWKKHALWFRLDGGIKSRNVNVNDEYYLGGRINYRAFGQIAQNTLFYGYEDFSISGETLLLLSTGYTFPIILHKDKWFGPLYVDSLFGSIFFEAGNVWNYGETKNLRQNPSRDETLGQGETLLTDVGVELKFKSFLFSDWNAFNSVLRVAYGFQDKAHDGFSDQDSPVRIYLGIGTNF